jgi:hypothetical protein
VVEEGALRLDGAGAADDGWRALAAAAWAHLDETGACVETDGLTPPG